MHGGSRRQPVGSDCPSFRHGLFSRHAPAALRDRIRKAAADRTLTDLREDIAFVTGLIAYRLSKLKADRRVLNDADEAALITLTDERGAQ